MREKLYFNYWIKEQKNEITKDRVLKLFRKELNKDVLLVDLDNTNRIEKKETQTANRAQ